jgi:hypothetical protein
MRVIEQRVVAKDDVPEHSEDMIVVDNGFAFVVDGATAKTDVRFDGMTGGRLAASLLAGAVAEMPAEATLAHAADAFTAAIAGAVDSGERGPGAVAAVFVGYSAHRHEVWRVGDAQWRTGRDLHAVEKAIDRVAAQARAAMLAGLLLEGCSAEELRLTDPGRRMIEPLLAVQHRFANLPAPHPLGYGVIDGRRVPSRFLESWPLEERTSEIVLASDGYPTLLETLDATERALRETIDRDPLRLYGEPATKGLEPDGVSFDDRAFVRLALR